MQKQRSIDYFILITTLILIAYGLIMVFSATYYTAASKSMYNNDGLFFLKKQLIGAAIGGAGMLIFSRIPYQKLIKYKYVFLVAALALLVAVLIPGLGKTTNGSSRWLDFKFFTLQPSEVAKFALIIFIAATIAVNQQRMKKFRYGILPVLLVLLICCGLIYLQPNFSAIVCLCIMSFVMVFVGGASSLQLGLIASGGIGAGALLMTTQSYRMDRILSFVDPWQYADTKGYQVIQSLYAIGAGGFFGRGLGNSRQKLLYLPYGESDFIFSIIVEELGFLGALVLLFLFGFLVYRGIKVAMRAPDMFGTMLATGIVTIIAVQVIINIAVVTSSIPATGVSMPFISYGSSALIIFMSMIGILLNISRQSKA